MKKILVLFMTITLLCAMISGCNSKATQSSAQLGTSTPQAVKHLNIGLFWFGTNLDPAQEWNGWTLTRIAVGETLVTVNKKMEFAPQLADSWKIVNDTTWEFQIRKGVTFHNGNPVTGAAVKSSIERSMKLNKRGDANLKQASVEADGQTVTFKTKEPYGAFLANLSEPLFVIVDTSADTAKFGDQPICTGPFMVTGFTKDVDIKIKRYDGYWGTKTAIETATIKNISDANTRALALQSGDLDIAQSIDVHSLPVFTGDKNFNIHDVTGIRVIYACLNTKNKQLSDVAVRQALSYGIDRETYAKIVGGGAVAAGAPFPPSVPYGYAKLTRQTYDVAKAKQLLADAGYADSNGDGTLDKNGKPLAFTISMASNTDAASLQLAQAMQSQLAKIGVKTEIAMLENVNDRRKNGDFDIIFCNFATAATGDPQRFLEANFTTGGTENYGKHSNAELDKAIKRLSEEFDTSKRANIATEAQQLVIDQAVDLFLVSPANNIVCKSTVKNIVPFPIDYYLMTEKVTVE